VTINNFSNLELAMNVPALTRDQMIEVDRLMIEEYGIQLIQMMENAGRNLAEMAYRMLGETIRSKKIAVLCGAGNNGGGGMVAARHLHNRGADVSAMLIGEPIKMKEVPELQWRIIEILGLTGEDVNLEGIDLIIDAMIGYGLTGNPRQPVAAWIQKANASGHPILALDAPSGFNATTGIPGDSCIQAAVTMTLALPKTGLLHPTASSVVGELHLADISVPPDLYQHLDLTVGALFTEDTIIHIS
jgi:NAD(P)H-hydrate epimerase